MRIGVVGAGGAGGHFAARWAEAGHEVTVVARGAHGEAIDGSGLKLLSPLGDVDVRPGRVATIPELPEIDCLVFATKSFQLAEAAAEAASLPGSFATFGLQNGVTATRVLRDALPRATVFGATCRVISLIDGPGVIRHVGAHPTIILGAVGEVPASAGPELAEALDVPDKLTVLASDRIDFEIWNKFLFFAPISGVGSASGLTIGALRDHGEWRELLADAMSEVKTIAAAADVALGDDAVERTLAFVDGLPAEGTSSLQRDIAEGRPNELSELSGRVVQMGEEFGIATPAHATILERIEQRAG